MSSYGSMRSGSYYRPAFFGGFSMFPPVIKALIISNAVVLILLRYLLQPLMIGGHYVFQDLSNLLALHGLGSPYFWPWQFVTYMFMHADFLHFLFNMLALWMFGMEMENSWGSRKFFIFYMLCGVGAGVVDFLAAPLIGHMGGTVGASGAVFGVMIAFAMLFPDRPIYVYFLFPVRAKYLVTVWIGLEVLNGVLGTENGVAHFAHLGGAAIGFMYMAIDLGWIPLREWTISFKGEESLPFSGASRARKVGEEVRDAKFYDISTGRPVDRKDEVGQDVIDAILDKISTGGYQSLSEEEKRILNEASRRMH
jgi:membrane associated rhomboid family serine protease